MRALTLLLLAVATPPAAAQARRAGPGDWEFGIDIGASQFRATDVEPFGTRISMFTSRALTVSLAATFDITCTNGMERFPEFALETDFTICTGSLGAEYNLPGARWIWPYVRLAIGQAQLDRLAAENEFDIDDRSLSVQAAVGGRIFFRPCSKTGLRVETQWLRTELAEREYRNVSVGVGVTYVPGRGSSTRCTVSGSLSPF